MLDPKELRIGNLLYPNHIFDLENTPLLGYSICAGHIAYSKEKLNFDWKPILLTPEILEKCGFESDNNGWKANISETMFLWWGELECIMRMCSSETIYSYPIYLKEPVYHFQFLHQLQNLYFSLTGTELEIKL